MAPLRNGRRTRRGFTLAELLMAMMVAGVILSAVVSLSWALSTYQNEGDGLVDLATNGRFFMPLVGRDIRASKAAAVTSTGALVLWYGDVNGNGCMGASEFVVYYKPSNERAVRRFACQGAKDLGAISPSAMQWVVNACDTGTLATQAQASGLIVQDEVVCRDVDSVAFYPNRAMPQTLSIEILLSLSCAQNVVEGTGRTMELNLYDSAAMRAPHKENGFDPQT